MTGGAASAQPEGVKHAGGGRSKELDFLRAVAVILVLFRHSLLRLEGADRRVLQSAAWLPIEFGVRVGWLGVDLFFVLSGFLVSGLLFAQHRKYGYVSPLHFWKRRALRIFPPFYVFYALALFISIGVGVPGLSLPMIVPELIFLQNFVPSHMWMHTWSLAVEEHFYSLLALTFFFFSLGSRKSSFSWIPAVQLILSLFCLVTRLYAVFGFDYVDWQEVVFRSHHRIDSLYFGVFISYLSFYHGSAVDRFVDRWRGALWMGTIALLIPNAFLDIERSAYVLTFGFAANYIAFGFLLLLCGRKTGEHGALYDLITRIGMRSYSVYLWHFPMYYWSWALFFGNDLPSSEGAIAVHILIYMIASVAAGFVFATTVEEPLQRLRDRLLPSLTPAPLPSGPDSGPQAAA